MKWIKIHGGQFKIVKEGFVRNKNNRGIHKNEKDFGQDTEGI